MEAEVDMHMAPTTPKFDQLVARLERVERLVTRRGKARREDSPAAPLPWRRWMPKFLQVLRRTGNVSEAIRSSPRSRKMVYEYRDRCEAFASAWDSALEEHRSATSNGETDEVPS